MSRVKQQRNPTGRGRFPGQRTQFRPGLLLGLLLLVMAGPAVATSLEPLTVDDLTRRADVVLRGRVESVSTSSHGPGRMPVTTARIEVLELLAGDLPPRRHVLVTQPGGRADGVELEYAGRPQFSAAQEVVLFLERRAPGQFITIGLAQGKFHVAPAGSGESPLIYRDLHGAAFSRPERELPPADLAELRRRVKGQPRNVAGGKPGSKP